ncbi:hypothetical protein D3C85_1135440 [compost metagenome]
MAGTRVAATAVDLLHDHRSFRQAEPRAAVLLRNQRRQPARFGQRIDEGFRVAPLLVDLAEVLVGKRRTEAAHGVPDFLEVIRLGLFDHGASPAFVGVAMLARFAVWRNQRLRNRAFAGAEDSPPGRAGRLISQQAKSTIGILK